MPGGEIAPQPGMVLSGKFVLTGDIIALWAVVAPAAADPVAAAVAATSRDATFSPQPSECRHLVGGRPSGRAV